MGDLAREADKSGSVLVTKRWDTPIGQIGVLGDLAYSRLSSNSHFFRVEPYFRTRISGTDYYIPGGYTFGEEQFQRTRTGIYGAVQWRPADAFTLTATFFQSRCKNRSGDWGAFVASQSLAVNPADSQFDSDNILLSSPSFFNRDAGTFQAGGPITTGGSKGAYASRTTTRDYSLSFSWTPEDKPLSIKGALQRVTSSQIYTRLDVFRDVAFPAGFGLDTTTDIPTVTVPASSLATFANPANYFWTASMPHDEDNSGKLDSANLDLEYKFEDSFFRSVKFGGRYAKRTERDFANGYNWAVLGRGWNGDPQLTYANAAPGDVELHVFKNFFHGQTTLPANLISTAQDAGWMWDIGLDRRRGIGHVYSSAHIDDAAAEARLRAYVGPAAEALEFRKFRFDAGYRETSWHRNCVAIGLSSGFFEPLEATGIVFSEVAADMVANLFPWGGDYETSARQFNRNMRQRYERALDFIKLHYGISERRDSDFWRDNVAAASIPDSLHELLDRWRFRPPTELDTDPQVDIFTDASWQYVLYGMGWKSDLSAKAGLYRYHDDARAVFDKVKRQAAYAIANLPSNRDLVEFARTRGFGPQGVAA